MTVHPILALAMARARVIQFEQKVPPRTRQEELPPPQAMPQEVPVPQEVTALIGPTVGGIRIRGPMRTIMDEVAAQYGVLVDDLRSPARHATFVKPRQEFFFRAASETNASLVQVGEFCIRDHTTVLHGIATHCTRHGLTLPRNMKNSAARQLAWKESQPPKMMLCTPYTAKPPPKKEKPPRPQAKLRPPPKVFWDKAWLEDAYVVRGLTAKQIGKEAGCSDRSILYWLNKHDILRREVIPGNPMIVQKFLDKAWLEDAYVTRGLTTREIAREIGSRKNRVSYWLVKHGIPRRSATWSNTRPSPKGAAE